MTERGKGKNEAEGGKKEGPASVPLQRATHASPPPDPQRTTTPSRPRAPRADRRGRPGSSQPGSRRASCDGGCRSARRDL